MSRRLDGEAGGLDGEAGGLGRGSRRVRTGKQEG